MKKIVLFLMIVLSVSIFATDVSNFDIKGIRLGMSKDRVSKLFHVKPYIENYVNDNRNYLLNGGYSFKLKNNRNIEDTFSGIDYRYDKKIYDVLRFIYYYTPVDANKIEKAVKEKYGTPDKIFRRNNEYQMCWGTCKKDKSGFLMDEAEGKNFMVFFKEKGWERDDGTHCYLQVTFFLYDRDMYNSVWEYEKKTKVFLEKKSKEINSKIDL